MIVQNDGVVRTERGAPRLTNCIEDGCDYSARYIKAVRGGYQLTCGRHKPDGAIDLAEYGDLKSLQLDSVQ